MGSAVVRCSTLRLYREMGRWAQAARRGGERHQVGPTAPPKPLLYVYAGNVTQLATGEDDVGGTVSLWASAVPAPYEWEFVNTEAWERTHNWGPAIEWFGVWMRAKETGNGTTYEGDSEWSEVLYVV